MQENLKDILSNLNKDVDQETLLHYLQGKLSAEQQHEVEKQMMDNDFEADALEGLQELKDQRGLELTIDQLQRELRLKTQKKKQWRQKLKLKQYPIILVALIIVLILIIISYIILYKFNN